MWRGIGWSVGLLLASSAGAEVWQDELGRSVEGKLAGTYGSFIAIEDGNQARLLQIGQLSDAVLDRVAMQLDQLPSTPLWRESKSAVAGSLRRRLQVYDGSKLVDFEPGDRPEPKLYLVYFSAHWCGPCRQFTPKLLEVYRQLKALPRVGEQFELVFVSNDRNPAEQLQYVREENMPWTVLKYHRLGQSPVVERWAGNGIPCLVALTPEGDVLFHTYRGKEYRGPDEPLGMVVALLQQMDVNTPEAKRNLHRLAVRQHVRRHGGGDAKPQPYLVGFGLNPERYRAAGVDTLRATLTVDGAGRVLDAVTVPELETVAADHFRRQAKEWLFLPAVADGRAVETKVSLPLKF